MNIEILRKQYEKFIPMNKKLDAINVVTVFNTRSEYLAYIPKGFEWSGGIWLPTRRELVISPPDVNSKKLAREIILGTCYHEAFHQYAFYALESNPPIWFSEGHASLFESVDIDRGKKAVKIKEDKLRLASFKAGLKRKPLNLKKLMTMEYKVFYRAGNIEFCYPRAWALAYFLNKATHLYPQKEYDKILPKLKEVLAETLDWKAAADASVKVVDMDELQKDFLDFWNSKSKRRKANKFDVFKHLAKQKK
ncbi:MAG: DUF1570 domain-containing protein [Lentisphaeria bacterium]|nr:DUF1570 domain-containing protein [Lentisphaeria bacterium]